MIDYSITKQENARLGGTVIFALPQIRGYLTTEQLAKHISEHGSKYNPGDIAAVMYEISSCVKELVLQGMSVQVGYLGEFRADLESTGFTKSGKKPEEFTADDIHTVTLRWIKPDAMKNMRREATLNLVVSRQEQKEGVKDVRESLVQSTSGQGNVGA